MPAMMAPLRPRPARRPCARPPLLVMRRICQPATDTARAANLSRGRVAAPPRPAGKILPAWSSPSTCPSRPCSPRPSRRCPPPTASPAAWSTNPSGTASAAWSCATGTRSSWPAGAAKPLTPLLPRGGRERPPAAPARSACVDAEIVVRSGAPGEERLQWEHLSPAHPPGRLADRKLSPETPAELVCFDLLALGDESPDGPAVPRAARPPGEALLRAHGRRPDPPHPVTTRRRRRPRLVRAVRGRRPGRRRRQAARAGIRRRASGRC